MHGRLGRSNGTCKVPLVAATIPFADTAEKAALLRSQLVTLTKTL